VRQTLGTALANAPEVVNFSVANGSKSYGEYRNSKVIVYVDPKKERTTNIPEKQNGINIEVKEQKNEPKHTASGNCYDSYVDPVPGGHKIVSGQSNVNTSWPATSNAESYMMTCAHQFKNVDKCGSSAIGTNVYQGGQKFGEIAAIDTAQDWSLIDYNITSRTITESLGSGENMIGHVTRDGLASMQSTQETIYKQGYRTCRTTGTVKELDIEGIGCEIGQGEGKHIYVDVENEPGDSGGPVYWLWLSGNTVNIGFIGVLSGNIDFAVAMSGYGIVDKHDIKFA
jgi:hypothetical protein